MRSGFFKGVVLGAVVSTGLMLAASAMAGTGVGGVFNLGQSNSVNATTTLIGSSAKTLQLENDANGPALGLHVKTGQAPFTTNSPSKVLHLNADQLDGIDSTGFVQGSGKAVRGFVSQSNPAAEATIFTVPGFGTIRASCDAGGFELLWENGSSSNAEQVWDSSDGITEHDSETIGQTAGLAGGTSAKLVSLEVAFPGHVATGTISGNFNGLGGCSYALQAVTQ